MNATMPMTISTAIAPAQNPVLKMAPIASHPDMNTASDTTGTARASEMDVVDTATSLVLHLQCAGPARACGCTKKKPGAAAATPGPAYRDGTPLREPRVLRG